MELNGLKIVNPVRFRNYAEWLARLLTAGVKTATHDCPHCNAVLYVQGDAESGEKWDSTCVCPVCGKMFSREIIHGETVQINVVKLVRGW